jgi:hypothetical protein
LKKVIEEFGKKKPPGIPAVGLGVQIVGLRSDLSTAVGA